MSTLPIQRSSVPGGAYQRVSRRPRGKTCRWTPELDEILKAAWARGGFRAARRAIRQLQSTWSPHSVRRRAAILGLCRSKARQWTEAEQSLLEAALEGNASLARIARRLGRTVAAIRKRLWDLGHKAESLGGYKVKDLAEMLGVTPARVQYWVAEGFLFAKGGRITDHSFSKFLREYPRKIPFESLSRGMQNWLADAGYPTNVVASLPGALSPPAQAGGRTG